MRNFNPRSPWGERHEDLKSKVGKYDISIHALREESDLCMCRLWRFSNNFNPRSPWGERRQQCKASWRITNFNPRSPWGERLLKKLLLVMCLAISIHALREESDHILILLHIYISTFQSTLSVRRATIFQKFIFNKLLISIHALREESDTTISRYILLCSEFQSTLSVRRATRNSRCRSAGSVWISIHALREESDPPHVF